MHIPYCFTEILKDTPPVEQSNAHTLRVFGSCPGVIMSAGHGL